MSDYKYLDRRADAHDDLAPAPASTQADIPLIAPSRFSAHIWFFRLSVVAIAYTTVAFCGWLADASTPPLLQAIVPAIGVMFGFLILHFKNH